MSFLASIQSFLPRPDNRSRDQIEQDLEDEIAFHLECKTRALMAATAGTVGKPHGGSHLEREAASDLARKQFGDVEGVKNECRRIALKERIMLQRVNFVMMAVVLLVVIAVGAQVLITQRYNTLALQAITTDLAKMKFEAGGKAPAGASSPADGEARVLVEGDVSDVGWHVIDMDRGTLLSDLLRSLGVKEDQWVTYRRNGTGPITPSLATDYLHADQRQVLRPNDELRVSNEVGVSARRDYWLRRWREDSALHIAWQSASPTATWNLLLSKSRGTLVQSGREDSWTVMLQGYGCTLQKPERPGTTSNLDWDVRNGNLVLDFATLRADARNATMPPSARAASELIARMPDVSGELVFTRVADDAEVRRNLQAAERARAVGRFVLDLFASINPKSPTLEQDVMRILDDREKNLDNDYPNDPVTVGVIRELIAARRKVFAADQRAAAQASAEAKVAAVNDFLVSLLTEANPAPRQQVTVKDVLDKAADRANNEFSNQPEVLQRVHDAIDKARQSIAAPAAPTAPALPDSAQLTPFRGVRWKSEWTPVVNVEGQWYELVSIDVIDAKTIVDHCRKPPHGDEAARKLFSEDLLTVLKEMQHPIAGDTVKLQVKDLASGTVMAIGSATMSAANHDKAVQENAAAASAGKPYPAWE